MLLMLRSAALAAEACRRRPWPKFCLVLRLPRQHFWACAWACVLLTLVGLVLGLACCSSCAKLLVLGMQCQHTIVFFIR